MSNTTQDMLQSCAYVWKIKEFCYQESARDADEKCAGRPEAHDYGDA